jgi:hypothetical protein
MKKVFRVNRPFSRERERERERETLALCFAAERRAFLKKNFIFIFLTSKKVSNIGGAEVRGRQREKINRPTKQGLTDFS